MTNNSSLNSNVERAADYKRSCPFAAPKIVSILHPMWEKVGIVILCLMELFWRNMKYLKSVPFAMGSNGISPRSRMRYPIM